MGSMSQEELISWLYQLIEYELDKPDGETDHDLIAECSAYLEELQADEYPISNEEILSRLEQIKQRVAVEKATSKPMETPIKKKSRRRFFKIFIPIAATFLALILTLSVAASVNGTSIGKFISDNLPKILGINKGKTVEEGDIAVVKPTERTRYYSVEEFLKAENPDILFPQPLPDGVAIKEIQLYQTDDNAIILFTFENDKLEIWINNDYQKELEHNTCIEEINTDTLHCYIFLINEKYYAYGQHNGNQYIFNSSDLNLVKQTIINMKETKQ